MSTRDITLRWDDPNMIEKGHKVYRSKSPMDINNMPVPIAILDKNATEYVDVGQTVGDTNYYRVSAFIDGYERFSSEYSIEISDVLLFTRSTSNISVYDGNGIKINTIEDSGVYSITQYNNIIFSDGYTIYKYDYTGNLIYSFNIRGATTIKTDIFENIYFQAGGIVYKYDNNGVFQWNKKTNNTTIYDIVVDSLGYVFVSSDDNTIAVVDKRGNIVDRIGYYSTSYTQRKKYSALLNNDIYLWNTESNKRTYKYNRYTGEILATSSTKTRESRFIHAVIDGNVYITSDLTQIEKLDHNLDVIRTIDIATIIPNAYIISDVAIDIDENIYVNVYYNVDDTTTSRKLAKISSNSEIMWEITDVLSEVQTIIPQRVILPLDIQVQHYPINNPVEFNETFYNGV